MTRDEEVAQVVSDLAALLGTLEANVNALNGVLLPANHDGHDDGQEVPVP
jgi:hypothetical protein